MKNEKKHHGTVDESSLEHQKSMRLPWLCENLEP